MLVLTEKGLGDAIQEYIEKDERDAIGELVNFQIDKMQVKKNTTINELIFGKLNDYIIKRNI